MMTGEGDAADKPSVDAQMLNQVREIVSCLFNQSKILDKCQVRVTQAISKAIAKCSAQLFQPFTSYVSYIADAV